MITFAIIAILLFVMFGLPCGIFVVTSGGHIQARLIACGLRTPIRLKKPTAKSQVKEEEAKAEPQDWSDIVRSSVEVALYVLEEFSQGLFQRLAQTRRRFARVFHFKAHKLFLSIASPDPFFTGCAYGAASALSPLTSSKFPFEFEADFESQAPRADVTASLTFVPAHLIFELIRTLFVFRVFKLMQLKKSLTPR